MTELGGQSSTVGDDPSKEIGVQGGKKTHKQGEVKCKNVKPVSGVPKNVVNILDIMGGKEFQGAGNLHGYNFQTKMICLYLCLASDLKNVRLATEVQAAGKFDDLVLCYEREGETHPSFCFLQAKQDLKSAAVKITPNDLKVVKKQETPEGSNQPKDPKFSLNMYFESYLQIQKQFNNEKVPLSSIEYLIMFTNADFDYRLFNISDSSTKGNDIEPDKMKITLQKLVNPDSPLIPPNSYQFAYIPPKLSSAIFGEVDSKTLEGYLEKLVFAANQPDFNRMDDSIKQALGQKFNLVESHDMTNKIVGKMWNIYSQKVGSEISQKFSKFFDESFQEVNRPFMSGITFSKRNDKLSFECNFKDTEPLVKFFVEGKSQVNIVASETPALSSVKAAQALQSMYKKRRYSELYFAIVDMPTLMKNKERIHDTLQRKNEFVLVIKLDHSDMMLKDIFDNLLSSLAETTKVEDGTNYDPKKKLVFICSAEVNLTKLPFKTETCNRFEDHCSFADITDKSKSELIDHKVTFQGWNTTMAHLIEDTYFKTMKFNVHLCECLTETEDFKIGQMIKDLGTEESYYVERRFKVNVRFGKHLKGLPSTELLVFSKVDKTFLETLGFKKIVVFKANKREDISDCDAVLLDESNSTTEFKVICNEFPSRNIHWFEKNGDSIDLVMLVQNTDLSEEAVMRNTGKLKIITGEPGIGKSTVLTSILNMIKSEPLSWIIRINLLDVCSDLTSLKAKDRVDFESALDLLCKAEKLENDFEKELLRYTITKTERLSFLFFDGFDEICPFYEETVLKMLKVLQETKAEIWVATRSNFQTRLEDEFSQISYGLIPFSDDDQKSYLQRFWSNELGVHANNSAIADFIVKVSEIFTHSHIQSVGKFTRIPLLTQMLAVIYQKDCEKFCASSTKELKIHTAVNILDLYDKFVTRKYTLYCTTKLKLDESNPYNIMTMKDIAERFYEQHKKLAIKLLFQDDFESLVTSEIFQSINEEQQLLSVGLLLKKNGKFSFIHRTFAEYFAAKHLADALEKERERNSPRYQFLISFLRQQYFIQTNTMMRIFLDYQLARSSEVLKAAVNDDLAQMVQILEKNPERVAESDILGRTPWLLAAAYSRHWELPKYKQKSMLTHMSAYYQVYGGETMSCIVELLWKLKDNFDVDSVDALGFNVICHAIGALDPNRKTVIFKATKLEFAKMEKMVLGVLDMAFLLDRDPQVMKCFLKSFLSKKMTAFWQGERCQDFIRANTTNFRKMVTIFRLAPPSLAADLCPLEFVNYTLTIDNLFAELLVIDGIDSLLKKVKDIHKTEEFKNWLAKRVQSCDFASLDKIQKMFRIKVADMSGIDFDDMFKMAVETLNNKWVLALLPQIKSGWNCIDCKTYFKKLFINRQFKDFHMALAKLNHKSLRTEVLGEVDYIAVFHSAIENKDFDDLQYFFKMFSSKEDVGKMKASVEISQVIEYFQYMLRTTKVFRSELLLSCISAEECKHVWDVLAHHNKSKLQKVIAERQDIYARQWEISIDATDLPLICMWLDCYSSSAPEDFHWSVWEHVYCLFCWLDSGIALPPDISMVLGVDFIRQVLDNKEHFCRVSHIFHLATDEQKRAICKADDLQFLKHALRNYLNDIIDVKCGNGKYLEKMQNEILKLSEYQDRFSKAAENHVFDTLIKLTIILSPKKQLNMWATVNYTTLFRAAFEVMEVDFLINLLNLFEKETKKEDLLALLDSMKISITSFSAEQVKKLDRFFSFLKRSDQRSEIANQLDIVAEFRTAVCNKDHRKLQEMFDTFEHCSHLIRVMKEKVGAQECIEYFKYFITVRDCEGICGLLQYISLQDDKVRRSPSFAVARIMNKDVLQCAIATVSETYLQELINSLSGYKSTKGSNYTIWMHIYSLFDGFWRFYYTLC